MQEPIVNNIKSAICVKKEDCILFSKEPKLVFPPDFQRNLKNVAKLYNRTEVMNIVVVFV